MGNQCISSNSIKIYAKELNVNTQDLKSQWTAIQSYNIKRMFQKLSEKPSSSKQSAIIHYEVFCQMFPQLIRYQEIQKRRVFQIFDRSNNGYVSWTDFYDTISICYFSSDTTLATLMFIIFDELLEKQLDESQLQLLVDLNANFMRDESIIGSEQQLQTEVVIKKLLNNEATISLEKWVQRSFEFFDFKEFRRIFNIFKQQKLEKLLVQNFHEWNQLFQEDQNKYISYIISFKWFESWKIYVERQYGISLSLEEKNPVTMKSIKTKKSLKTNNSKSKRHITNFKASIKIKNEMGQVSNLENEHSGLSNKFSTTEVKNFDLVRNKIGERPKKIENNFLQGEYSGIMKSGLVQNRDYVFVSEKVWNYLIQIYSGEPEFRRTGFDQIQMYPKITKIFSGLFKSEIDYSSQVVREVSNSITIEDLMIKSLQIQTEYLKSLSIFYRAFGMPVWQQITNFRIALGELTQNPILLLIYVEKRSRAEKQFKQKYLISTKSIKQSNLGDSLIYEDILNKTQKQAVFFNRNLQGKYIIHFVGESYSNDLCLSERQFLKSCKISNNSDQIVQVASKSMKVDKRRRGIEIIKNFSFVTSMIIQMLENPHLSQFESQLSSIKQDSHNLGLQGTTHLSIIIAYINRLLKANKKVDPKNIILLAEMFFSSFKSFNITQINPLINSFFQQLKQQATILKLSNTIKNEFEFSIISKAKCPKCGCIEEQPQAHQFILPLSIPESLEGYYQIIFVPFCLTMTSHSLKRYGFELPKNSTLKDYKQKFEIIAQIQKRPYILLEIEGNSIIKNFTQIRDQLATLESLHLRESDNIFAFQICTDLTNFVTNHFSFTDSDNCQIEQKDFKVGEMIDCKSPDKGWIFGKIVDKDIMPYTYQQNLKVLHRNTNSEVGLHSYKQMKNVVSLFPSHSHKNCDQYHVRMVQRVFSEANNQMIYCNIPLVIVLASWMRPRQFQYIVYLQIQKFIASEFSFQGENVHANFVGSSTIQKNIIREATKIKVKKFKEYLYGKNLPYKLNFINNNGHCLICYKFVKSVIYKGESENYCEGCVLPNDDPISWQIMVEDLVIAVDWRTNKSFTKQVIKNTASFVSLSSKKKKEFQTIESCIQITLNSQQQHEMLCCNTPLLARKKKILASLPNILMVSLSRTAEQNGFKRNVAKPIYFGDENIVVQGQQYKLIGVIASIGHQNSQNYIAYIKQDKGKDSTKWLAYNGQKVEIIKKQQIDKKSTHVFLYKKVRNNTQQKIEGLVQKKEECNYQKELDAVVEEMIQTDKLSEQKQHQRPCQIDNVHGVEMTNNEEQLSQQQANSSEVGTQRNSNKLLVKNIGLDLVIKTLKINDYDFDNDQ